MQEIEFLLCDVAALWRKAFNMQTKRLDISNVERRIIIVVARNPGSTQMRIAGLLDLEPQNLIKPLDKLIAHDWLERRPDAHDRRVNRIYPKEACTPILEKIEAIGNEIRPLVLTSIEPSQIEQFATALSKMKDNLEHYLHDETEHAS